MLKLIKLSTGEEVLAKVEVTNVDHKTMYVLDNPVRLQLSQKGVAMIPLSPFMKEGAKINIDEMDVLYTVDPDEDVVNGYNQQFGGIVVAPPGITLG